MGIAEQCEGDARNPNEWRDTHFQVEGPVVQGLQAAFKAGRRAAKKVTREDIIPSCPESVNIFGASSVFLNRFF